MIGDVFLNLFEVRLQKYFKTKDTVLYKIQF
jgi:hypothetical protein